MLLISASAAMFVVMLTSVPLPLALAADDAQRTADQGGKRFVTSASKPAGVLSTRSQLESALATARDGDRLLLAAGDYGPLSIRNRQFSRGIELISADPGAPAVFSSVRIVKSSGISLQKLIVRFTPDEKTIQSDSAVFIKDSNSVSLSHTRLIGGLAVSGAPESTPAGQLDKTGNVLGRPAARALTVSTSQGIELSDNDVSVFHMGIVLDRVADVVLARNVVHNLRTTPLAGRQVSQARIEGNHFHSFRPWKFGGAGDHGDLIHFYTMRGAPPSRDIVIRANWLDQGDGDPLLGIYLDDNKFGVGFLDVIIEHNFVLNGNHQGIRLENVQGIVRNNTLVLPKGEDPKKAPQILAVQKSNLVVTSNVLSRISVYPESIVKEQDNVLVPLSRRDRGDPYGRVFVGSSVDKPTPKHFALQARTGRTGAGADMALIASQLGRRGGDREGRTDGQN